MNPKFGFAKVSLCSPEVSVGDPVANCNAIKKMFQDVIDSDVIVFPELSMTGYTCGVLFQQELLLDCVEKELQSLATNVGSRLLIVGAPIWVETELFNCAVLLHDGKIIGIVPKQNIPNYKEFYEGRYFAQADGDEPKTIFYAGQEIPFGTDLLFEDDLRNGLVVSVDICEDLWMPVPPSSIASVHGANLTVNLSASNETVAKHEYRVELVKQQSGRCLSAYAYCSANATEDTTDVVFSGDCIVAENGNVLSQSSYVGDGTLNFGARKTTVDIDVQRLTAERKIQKSFGESKRLFPKTYRRIAWASKDHAMTKKNFNRHVEAFPFVPSDPKSRAERCSALFDIQCAALSGRLKKAGLPDVYIGVSGGSDSTHALLVTHKTFTKVLNLPTAKIHGITMPGFGTTDKTKGIAITLMKELGITSKEVDIRPACIQTLLDIGHKPFGIDISIFKTQPDKFEENVEWFKAEVRKLPKEKQKDLTFENVQAGIRTMYLMRSGFTLGTGDMSELALGWCTYGVGDHMSHYNVNCSIPKTLIKFMIEFVANNHYPDGELRKALLDCFGLIYSPELLLPSENGEIEQSTEDKLGPYELHDFYLYYFARYGFSPEKIMFLADNSELNKFEWSLRKKTMETFIHLFFSQQYKRDCVPGGPKGGSVSLSPRGDWRMPSSASDVIWIQDIPMNVGALH